MTRSEHLEDLVDDTVRVKSGLRVHGRRTVVIDEDIRQHHAADLESRSLERARFAERLHNVRSKSTNGTFLNCDQQFMLTCQLTDEFVIEWLGEASIGDGR